MPSNRCQPGKARCVGLPLVPGMARFSLEGATGAFAGGSRRHGAVSQVRSRRRNSNERILSKTSYLRWHCGDPEALADRGER